MASVDIMKLKQDDTSIVVTKKNLNELQYEALKGNFFNEEPEKMVFGLSVLGKLIPKFIGMEGDCLFRDSWPSKEFGAGAALWKVKQILNKKGTEFHTPFQESWQPVKFCLHIRNREPLEFGYKQSAELLKTLVDMCGGKDQSILPVTDEEASKIIAREKELYKEDLLEMQKKSSTNPGFGYVVLYDIPKENLKAVELEYEDSHLDEQFMYISDIKDFSECHDFSRKLSELLAKKEKISSITFTAPDKYPALSGCREFSQSNLDDMLKYIERLQKFFSNTGIIEDQIKFINRMLKFAKDNLAMSKSSVASCKEQILFSEKEIEHSRKIAAESSLGAHYYEGLIEAAVIPKEFYEQQETYFKKSVSELEQEIAEKEQSLSDAENQLKEIALLRTEAVGFTQSQLSKGTVPSASMSGSFISESFVPSSDSIHGPLLLSGLSTGSEKTSLEVLSKSSSKKSDQNETEGQSKKFR